MTTSCTLPRMQKINQPSGINQTVSDSVTFFPNEGGWVARIQVTMENDSCAPGPAAMMVSWYQVMDEDELDDMLNDLCEQSIEEFTDEVEDDDVDPVEDKIQSMFEKGVGDGR